MPPRKKVKKKATQNKPTKSQPRKSKPNARSTNSPRSTGRSTASTRSQARTIRPASRVSSSVRPKSVRKSNSGGRTPARTGKAGGSRNSGQVSRPRKSSQPSLTRTAKAVSKDTRRTAATIKRNLKATKKAVKQIRDAFGRFTKAVKKASKKASKKNAAQQQAASRKAKKTAAKNQGRKSSSKQKAGKTPPQVSKPVRGHRREGRGKGNKVGGRSKAGGGTARNQPGGVRGIKPGKSSYRIQELASSRSKNLGKLAQYIEKNAEELDKLKQPNEIWGFQIYDRYHITPYESLSGMMDFLGNSGGLVVAGQENANLVGMIHILSRDLGGKTYEDNVTLFNQEVIQRHEEQRLERNARQRDAYKRFGRTTPQGRRKANIEFMGQYEAELQAKDKLVAEQRIEILRLEQEAGKKAQRKSRRKK